MSEYDDITQAVSAYAERDDESSDALLVACGLFSIAHELQYWREKDEAARERVQGVNENAPAPGPPADAPKPELREEYREDMELVPVCDSEDGHIRHWIPIDKDDAADYRAAAAQLDGRES